MTRRKPEDVSAERLRECVHYDEDTGTFTALINRGKKVRAGQQLGNLNANGYLQFGIDNASTTAAQWAFLYMEGYLPEAVSHKNKCKTDTRWDNLRSATQSELNATRGVQKNNKCGLKGVAPFRDKHKAKVVVNGEIKYLKYFSTPERAARAYIRESRKYYGEFFQTQ